MNAPTLDSIIRSTDRMSQVRKADLHPGDVCFVKTLNSVYRIRVGSQGKYEISGGWFSKKGLDGCTTTIAGCTWGGSVIKTDIIAACGLCVEFGNRVITSAIQKVILIRHWNVN